MSNKRAAIRSLLVEREPADAVDAYYAFHHGQERTTLHVQPADAGPATGYLCLSRTGMDLFRPLVTMRLPAGDGPGALDLGAAARLFEQGVPAGMPVILTGPSAYAPLVRALFQIHKEEELLLLVLDRGRFQPIINVLVTRSEAYNGLPRFVIRSTGIATNPNEGDVATSSGLNWQSPYFAEIYVHTKTPHRRQGLGKSVVAAAVQHVLAAGRTPLYAVSRENQASAQLAESVGFVDLGLRRFLAEGERPG